MNIYADKAYKKFLLKDVARFVQRDMTVDVVDNGAFVVVKPIQGHLVCLMQMVNWCSRHCNGGETSLTIRRLDAQKILNFVIVMRCLWVMRIIILDIL